MTPNKKVSVFCLWRDSEKTISRTLKQLEDLESLVGFSFSYFFYENDSKDNTVAVLDEWLSSRSGELKSENLDMQKFGRTTDPKRMKFLCRCRNESKKLAGSNDSDYSLLIDSDIKFNKENFSRQLDTLENCKDAVMVTANSRQNIEDLTFGCCADSYYDAYAFKDRHGNQGMYWSDCPSYKSDDQFNWKLGKPIITMSSFGGLAVIKSDVFNKVEWSADIHCDHVNMCYDISRFGNIYADPKSKIYVEVNLANLNLQSFANMAKSQNENYYKHF